MGSKRNTPLIGNKYNRLTIISSFVKQRSKNRTATYVIASCECGTTKEYVACYIISGHTKSCGCWKKDRMKHFATTHGMARHDSKHPIYVSWNGMKNRCYGNPNHKDFKYYGKLGVTMCEEWKNDFMAFYNWSMANGWKKGLTIDRFPDKNGSYEPSNCRWATRKQQVDNRSNSLINNIKK